MKKISIITLLGLIIISCSTNKLQKKDVFPIQTKADSVLVLNIDSIEKINNIDSIICSNRKYRLSNLLPVGYINLGNISIPFEEPRFTNCPYFSGISCFKESTFITIKRDSFYWDGESFFLDVKNVEEHLTQRFLDPTSMFLSDSRFTAFSIEISEKEEINKGLLKRQLSIISDSYFNFFEKYIPTDSINYYKEKYPFNLMIERPWNEILKSPPPPKPNRVTISEDVEI